MEAGMLDASVASRVPIRFSHDDRYFTDRFQAVPKSGYAKLFANMLDHPLIEVWTGIDYRDISDEFLPKLIVYTGSIDEFFKFKYGRLPYRSLLFRHELHECEFYQSVAVVNYPNEHAYTRITEFKHITGQLSNKTSILFEYPTNSGDPYYPIPRPENISVYRRYRDLALSRPDVIFLGRLGSYKYYNMDQVVAQALMIAEKIIDSFTI